MEGSPILEMAGIELGTNVYRIVGTPERARLEIHSSIVDLVHVVPKNSILLLTYNEPAAQIDITLLNGTLIPITIPPKSLGGERDTRSIPKLKKLFVELSDMIG